MTREASDAGEVEKVVAADFESLCKRIIEMVYGLSVRRDGGYLTGILEDAYAMLVRFSDENARLKAEVERLTRERDEAREWAQGWHRTVETICTIMGLSPALGADEAAAAVRAKFDDTARSQAEEMRKALEEKIAFWRNQEREWSKSKKDPSSILVAHTAKSCALALEELRSALSRATQETEAGND